MIHQSVNTTEKQRACTNMQKMLKQQTPRVQTNSPLHGADVPLLDLPTLAAPIQFLASGPHGVHLVLTCRFQPTQLRHAQNRDEATTRQPNRHHAPVKT